MVSGDKKTSNDAVWLAAARLKLRKEAQREALATAAQASVQELEQEVAEVLKEQFSQAKAPQTTFHSGEFSPSTPNLRRTPTRNAATPSTTNGLPTLIGAVELVLRKAGHPLHFPEILAAVAKMGLADPTATPSKVVWTPIHRLVKKGVVVVEGKKPKTVRLIVDDGQGAAP